MCRALVPLWRVWLPLAMVLVFVVWIAIGIPQLLVLAALDCCIIMGMLRFGRFNQSRLLVHALGCRTISTPDVIVHFPTRLSERVECEAIVKACQDDVNALVKWFGFKLRRRPAVYLFETESGVARIMRGPSAGGALCDMNAVLVPITGNFRPMLGHELTHLYAWRLGKRAPSLFREGLAVWFQCSAAAPVLDDAMVASIREGCLSVLLNPRPFGKLETQMASYALAGHFTHFLIQRVSWNSYLDFYRAFSGLR